MSTDAELNNILISGPHALDGKQVRLIPLKLNYFLDWLQESRP
jgi:hypothetical protein